jgi:phosphoserine phosphatase
VTVELRRAAFFRLEGVVSDSQAWRGALSLAASAPRIRHRVFGLGTVLLSAALTPRDPALTRSLGWSSLRGFSRDRVEVMGRDYALERLVPSVPPSVHRLLEGARAGRFVPVLIAEAIDAIAGPTAEALGFELTLCNALEWDRSGSTTGVLRPPVVGPEVDPKQLRSFAAEHRIDLQRSIAYGASRADALLLSLVGMPCAVDPDRALARIARDLDWPVLWTERKVRLAEVAP